MSTRREDIFEWLWLCLSAVSIVLVGIVLASILLSTITFRDPESKIVVVVPMILPAFALWVYGNKWYVARRTRREKR